MASVGWGKCQSATEAKAVLRHNCKDTRQATVNHSNKQLDTSKTYLNYGSREGSTYADACARYDARVDEVFSFGHTDKRAKVTMVLLEAPTPEELPKDKERAWFARFKQIAIDQLGQENFVGMWVHQDEIHDYLDPSTKQLRTSRVHGHLAFVAGYGEGDEVRLCAKKIVSRGNMNKLNNAVDKMSREEFGVRFLDGSKQKSKGKVEDIKRKSARALEEYAAELASKEAALDAREHELNEREARLEQRERSLDAAKVSSVKSEMAETGRKSVSLNRVKQQTNSMLRSVDGYNGHDPEFGR